MEPVGSPWTFCNAGYLQFFNHCLSHKDVLFLFLSLTVIFIALVFFLFSRFVYRKKNINHDYHTSEFSYATYKPKKITDLKSIIVHELGHAFIIMNFPDVYEKAFLQVYDRDIETIQQGYVFYKFNENVDQTNKKILYIKMLVLLGGMQAEKHYYEGDCSLYGATTDLMIWTEIAKIYLQHQDDNIFYINPNNQYENNHNTTLLHNLKTEQIDIISGFFNANDKLFESLIVNIMESKILSFEKMKDISKNIISTKGMLYLFNCTKEVEDTEDKENEKIS